MIFMIGEASLTREPVAMGSAKISSGLDLFELSNSRS